MQAGVREAAPDYGHPADVRFTSSFTRAQHLDFDRLLARTAGYEIRLARDAGGRLLAAKSLRADASAAWAEALAHEHACLGGLDSPHVVATAGLVESRYGPTLLLEYLGGGDLVGVRGFAARHWLPAARDTAAGLAALHVRGLAHRDVKARNVRFTRDGRACLVDLGSAARLGMPVSRAGTTAAHRRVSATEARAAVEDDIYAFAVLLYELATGRLPFGAGSEARVRRPARLATTRSTEALAALVMRTLDPAAADAPPALETFAEAIDSALDAERRSI